MYIYIYVYICMYTYIYREREGEIYTYHIISYDFCLDMLLFQDVFMWLRGNKTFSSHWWDWLWFMKLVAYSLGSSGKGPSQWVSRWRGGAPQACDFSGCSEPSKKWLKILTEIGMSYFDLYWKLQHSTIPSVLPCSTIIVGTCPITSQRPKADSQPATCLRPIGPFYRQRIHRWQNDLAALHPRWLQGLDWTWLALIGWGWAEGRFSDKTSFLFPIMSSMAFFVE